MREPMVLDLFRLDGKLAVITGGSKGLGRSIALGFAQAGATVVVCSRDLAACEAAAAEIAAVTGQPARGCEVDVTDEASVAALFDSAGEVDVLVNSAGINIRHPIEDYPPEEYRRVVDVNLNGTWLCCRAVAAGMKARRRGSVINVSSTLGAVALPERTAYAASKHGVIGMTKALALEWASSGVRCNAICPGPFLTEMNRPLLAQPERVAAILGAVALSRWAELVEIRGAALFLASEASSYVTGSSLFVDGGWTAA
ncbi:MAG: SDR family oxidoreductase [Armatimonadetes bacterium]|nr:SDR family oxidoreductase [Armatimonadota bacterium]